MVRDSQELHSNFLKTSTDANSSVFCGADYEESMILVCIVLTESQCMRDTETATSKTGHLQFIASYADVL